MKNLEDIINRIKFLNEQISPINEQKNNNLGDVIARSNVSKNLPVSTYVKPKLPLIIPKKSKKEDLPFETITDLTINHIEGGYYNPNLHKDGGMGKSGETMFGMDRKHGASFTESAKGKEFWELIDNDRKKNPKKWKRYYKLEDNPDLKEKLIDIISSEWLPNTYNTLSNTYIKDDETKNIINSDPKLKFHMSYACWNGQGFFKKFAKDLTDKIKNGIKDVNRLFDFAIDKRINMGGPIAKSGRIIKNEIAPIIS